MIKTLSYAVTGQRIETTETAMLVAGTVNVYTARFSFDEAWDGLQRTAVFASSDNTTSITREQLLTDDACTVPWEVLVAGNRLRVGVYGTKADGTRLPTIWTERRLYINPGAGPTQEAADPSPTLVEQLLGRIGDPANLKTEDKSSLVAAINEVQETGGGGGTSDHSKLKNRDAAGQHPMSAITGLEQALEGKQPVGSYITEESDPTVPEWAKQPQKPAYTAQEVGALPSTTAIPSTAADVNAEPSGAVSQHNVSDAAHSDIRLLIQGLSERLSAVADSDDTTLDQLSEIAAYIKSNKNLIDAITTSKVNVSDIVDNLTTNVANKPLSAAQGVALKALIDAISVPDKLPNPNALTFTGAVTGSYDGSEPVTVNIPSGGSGVADISLGITGAQVGQIAKITAVDTEGKPTAWSTVDMVVGEKWEKIAEIIIPEGADEVTALTINKDFDGNPFSLVKARLCAKFPKYTGATTIPNFSFAMLNGKTSGRVTPLAYTSVWPKVSASNITGTVYEIDVSGAQQFEHVKKSGNGGWTDDSSRDYVVYGSLSDTDTTWFGDTLWAKPITSIGGTGMLIYPGCRFVLYGVRA